MYVLIHIYRIKKQNISSFLRVQQAMSHMMKQHGAVDDATYRTNECSGIEPLTAGERIYTRISRFQHREHYEQVMNKVEKDRRMTVLMEEMERYIKLEQLVKSCSQRIV
ncbi:DUF1428 family protein [Mechercharimyces sp. CAU 1602]|uniref:DUF1428 family protein n=1 Tax=Mechercharimyces sp. CAU 1602 TaxID=2973933 RepID=UPI002161456B|nr:DUF1428 family protein [Mechercharimyces sp. CAU 1602]MCS1350848.1 DUF1428 family protein [Mechercharimyces sp. CAU 1602]